MHKKVPVIHIKRIHYEYKYTEKDPLYFVVDSVC